MKKDSTLDFTKGSIPRHLIDFSIPLFLGNLLQALYNTVDTIWVGKFLGQDALAAVSVSFPLIFVLLSLSIGITMATTVLVGQFKGAGDSPMIKKTIDSSLFLLAVLAVIMTAVGLIFHMPILRLMNTHESIIDMAAGYMNIIFIGMIFSFGFNVVSAVLRGLGDSRTPLLFLFYTTVINIILDPILIFGLGPFPKMGVEGAALATIIAQAISLFLAIRHLDKVGHVFSINFKDIQFDPKLSLKIIKVGLPAGLQQAVVSLGFTVVMSIVNTFGPTAVAAFGAAGKIDNFSFMPSMSIGLATSTLAAQNIGAGKYERVNETAKWAVVMSLCLSVVMMGLVFFVPEQLLSMFSSDVPVLKEGAKILRILGLSYIPFGLMWITNGVIRGAGDTVVVMLTSIFTLWGVRLPLAFYLSRYTDLGSTGVWIALSSSSFLSFVLSTLYYYSGRWKKAMLIDRRDGEGDGPLLESEVY